MSRGRFKNPIIEKTKAKSFTPHAFKNAVELLKWEAPKILMSKRAYATMWHIVNIAKDEVGWLGLVRQIGSDFMIDEVMLFKQEVSAATCEITPEGLAEVAMELVDAHPDNPDVLNQIRFWGHSHVDMGTTASGQDDSQMEVFANSGAEFFIRAILNKKGRMEFTLYLYNQGMKVNDVPWEVFTPVDLALEDSVQAEIDSKVSKLIQPYLGAGVSTGYQAPDYPDYSDPDWWKKNRGGFNEDPKDPLYVDDPHYLYQAGRWVYHHDIS